MTQEIIVRSDAINWTWYSWVKVGDITDGRATVEVTKSDRFHKFDERQGAGRHPVTDWRLDHSAHKPEMRKPVPWPPATEPTQDQIDQEKKSFEFFWSGWISNCQSAKVDPETTKAVYWYSNKDGQKLLGIVPVEK